MGQLVTILLLFLLKVRFSDLEAASGSGEENFFEVALTLGSVRGEKFISNWTNQDIYAFRGIPFASPPVKELRFKDPVKPPRWTSVLDCTADKASCYRPADMFSTNITTVEGMSEDCLYLNVYTPQIKPNALLPVIVWLHGGAYVTGSGSYKDNAPDFLVAEGVVVVTFNYRLGVFGFLTLDTAEVPGNAGLKDQTLALQWVQEEIMQFGGDPTQVTLFGQSAGSACVHLHYLSPLSEGLFHRAIGDSGTAIASWAARDDQEWYTFQLAEIVECNRTSVTDTLECLLTTNATTLLEAQVKVPPNPVDDTHAITLRFIPNIDTRSSNPFLPEMPETLMKKKKNYLVPFMMGTNRNEGGLDLFNMTEAQIKNSTNNLGVFIPIDIKKKISTETLKNLTDKIDNFYFNGTTPSYKNLEGFLDLNTDTWFAYSTAVTAKHYQKLADVFLYYFTFDGKFKEPKAILLEEELNISIVTHGEELNYIWIIEHIDQNANENSPEVITWKRMVRMWTNFAKYGVPANGSDPLLQYVTWLPMNQSSTRHMHIDVKLSMVHDDYLAERVAFWDGIMASSACILYSSIFTVVITFLWLMVQ